ncbi:hypothetical protein FQN60_003570, partial [Etheostoma spectabile]
RDPCSYGHPGVEFTGLHKDITAVTQILFLPGQGRLLSLLDDNTIHLWELVAGDPREVGGDKREGVVCLQEVDSYSLPGRPGIESCSATRVTVLLLLRSCDQLCMGTEGGGLYFLELPRLSLKDNQTLLQDQVTQSLPDDYRCGKSLGPVESLQEHPQQSGKILIGYSRGLVVLWDLSTRPFPCKAINKILWRTTQTGSPVLLYSGGMPRASYGDRHCLTIQQDKDHVTFDFTSRVIDFFTFDEPSALVVLLEEELVVIDLQTPGWPSMPTPYLAPLHSSAITCSFHISSVPPKLWERLVNAGKAQQGRQHAHGDGTVRFWDASGVALTPMYKLSTANVFHTDCDPCDDPQDASDDPDMQQEEEWPPFRKVGCFDPYSDDPRLGIQKISLCKYSNKLVVAGTAGQVIVLGLSDERSDHLVDVSVVDLLQDREGFTWKGHERLEPRLKPAPFPPGFQPLVLVQCLPPASVTAVALHAEWNLISFGTSHGFGLFDYHRRNAVLARCTLHPNDSLAMEGPLSRVKSLKKSLRQSFRRIRKSRVSGKKRTITTTPTSKVQEANAALAEQEDVAPIQRRIEPRSADDSLSGVVRCLCFADTFLRDGTHHGPTLWAGTNSGSVYAYALEVPGVGLGRVCERGGAGESSVCVEALLGKEIQLMHRAPVVSISVLDGRGKPLPDPYEASQDLSIAPEMTNAHSVLIASEEQLKVFSLPKVSAKTKFKLTAHEGCRVRKVALVVFNSTVQEDYSEHTLVCLTNLGDMHLFNIPGLRPQVRYDCIRKEDISGIASCVFTKNGQGFYLISPSEYERFSLSAKVLTEPLCSVQLDRPLEPTPASDGMTPQANGTHKNQMGQAEGQTEEPPSSLSSPILDTPLDSPLSFADLTLDSTGEITVEDVRDFLTDWDGPDFIAGPQPSPIIPLWSPQPTLCTLLLAWHKLGGKPFIRTKNTAFKTHVVCSSHLKNSIFLYSHFGNMTLPPTWN